MPWFKVDDGLHSHPKWIAASPHARALWVTAGSWCAAHLTDGHVPMHMLTLFGARPKDAAELVRLGLWVEADDEPGWRFHDWDQYQPSAASVMAERAAARERQRRARERAKQARESRGMSRRDARRDARRDSPVNDTVSHGPPDPTRPNDENKSSSNSRRGAGTPDDDEGTSQLNPTVGAAIAVLARHDLEQRQTAPDQPPVADPAAWERRAYKRRMEAHRSALEAFLADDPTLTPEKLAERVLGPSRGQSGAVNGHAATNGHSDPLAGVQAAARARAERHLRVIHGQACPTCNDTGWRLDPDSNEAVPCPHQTAQEAR